MVISALWLATPFSVLLVGHASLGLFVKVAYTLLLLHRCMYYTDVYKGVTCIKYIRM